MPIYVDGKKLIPAPLVTVNKQMNLTADGRPISNQFGITLEGTLLPNRGSPQSFGWWIGEGDPPDEEFVIDADRHRSLLRKQELIRSAFSKPGVELAYSAPGEDPVRMFGKLNTINFQPNPWVIRSDYQIDLSSATYNMDYSEGEETMFATGSLAGRYLSSVGDQFSFAQHDDGSNILDITRTLSATAFTAYDLAGSGTIIGQEAWMNARAWVADRLSSHPLGSGDTYRLMGLFVSGTRYNTIETEEVDKFAGTYSLSQRYVSHNNAYLESRQVQRSYERNLVGDLGPTYLERISVQGNIQGFAADNSPSGKLASAKDYYFLIATGLGYMAGALGDAITHQYTEDWTAGSISYSHEYLNASGAPYRHNYEVSFALPNGASPTVTIQGSVEGVTWDGQYLETSGGVSKWTRAASGWDAVKNTLKALSFAESTVFGGAGYTDYFLDVPVNKSVSFNKVNGIVNYNYTFGYQGADSGIDYIDEYTIEYNTSPTTAAGVGGINISATINGLITGLAGSGTPDLVEDKFTAAKTAWTTIRSNLYTRVNTDYAGMIGTAPPLSSGFVTRSVSLNRFGGTVGYSATFNNLKTPNNSGVAIQEVSVDDTIPNDIFAVQIIPGRSAGPILQNLGTTNEVRKTVNLSMTMYPKGGAHWDYTDKATIRAVASSVIFSIITGMHYTHWFLAGDGDNWDPKNGLYTRTTTAVYRDFF